MSELSEITIYVFLRDEAVNVWRPVRARRIGERLFRIISVQDDPDEKWEFDSGAVVECEERDLYEGRCLVAVREATDAS